MKNILVLLLTFCGISITLAAKASENLDSISFENQRAIVNNLLDERNQQFAEYDLATEQKSGIFGLFKTNHDMQRSIDILKTIVVNDNNILYETRKLIDIKDNEKAQFQALATKYDNQVTAYMKTISKLQTENEKLRENIKSLESDNHSNGSLFFVVGIIIAALLYVIYKLYMKLKEKSDVTLMS